MNCLLYARVSTDKQAEKELSIPAQLQAMRDYAHQRGWSVVEEFTEPGASGRTTDRPALQRLLSHIREPGREVAVVLVHKIDRLARNVYDHATIRALLEQHKIRLASVVENMDDSVSGQLVENIMASIAQFYSANLAEEVRKGMRQKVKRGGWPHLAPRGYINVRDDSGARVVPHPTESLHIRAAFELYASGSSSLTAVAEKLSSLGINGATGRPLAPENVRRLLTNPFYAGKLVWGDVESPGAHRPLVDEALFCRVRDMMSQRRHRQRPRGAVSGFPLRGLAICAQCRGRMTAGWQRSGSGRRFGYYRCARRMYDRSACLGRKSCPIIKAHDQVRILCESLRLSHEMLAEIRNAAEALVGERDNHIKAALPALTTEQASLREQALLLTKRFVAEEVTPEAYRLTIQDIEARLSTLQKQLSASQAAPAERMAKVDDLLQAASSVWQLNEGLGESRERKLLDAVFESLVLDGEGLIGFVLRPPFDSIFASAQESPGRDRDGATRMGARLLERVEGDGAIVSPAFRGQYKLRRRTLHSDERAA